MVSEFEDLFHKVGIPILKQGFYRGFYRMKVELEDQLRTTFADHASTDKIYQIFIEDTKYDTLGLESHLKVTKSIFPTLILFLKAKMHNTNALISMGVESGQ